MSCPALAASGPVCPQPVIRPYTRAGFRASRSSGPSPRRSITPGRNPSSSTSARCTSARTTSRSAGSFRSRAMDRLPRSSSDVAPSAPMRPPRAPRRSIRTTSAPRSASSIPQNGAGPSPANSTTRTPSSGPTAAPPATGAAVVRPSPGHAAGRGVRRRRRGGRVVYLLAAAGGALGALARWGVAEAMSGPPGGWPWATVLVNLTGCLLIGVLLGVLGALSPEPAWARPFLGAGFLGGYTTYSTFAVDVVQMAQDGALVGAAGYVLVSVLGGVAGVAAGVLAGRKVVAAR